MSCNKRYCKRTLSWMSSLKIGIGLPFAQRSAKNAFGHFHSHPAIGDPSKQAIFAAWDPRLRLQAEQKGKDRDVKGEGKGLSCASWITDGRWPLETLYGDRERLGVYGQYREKELQSGNAGPFSGVSASIPMPTRPRDSSAPRVEHGETPPGGCGRVLRPRSERSPL
eukprot:scaffold946_cov359-Pavlova_lutheri.AAC.7